MLRCIIIGLVVACSANARAQELRRPDVALPAASHEATATGTTRLPALQNNILTVKPEGPSEADYRAGNFEVHLRTAHLVEKTDALSGYVRHYGSGKVRDHVYGGTLQYFNHGDGGAEWGTGAMVAVHNLGNGFVENAAGLSALVRNERKAGLGVKAGEGVFAAIQNAGVMDAGNGVTGGIRNQGELAIGTAVRASLNNKGLLPKAYGLKVEIANTGNLGEFYGLHIDAIDGSPAKSAYAIYSLLPNPSRLAGDLQIGDRLGLQAQMDDLREQMQLAWMISALALLVVAILLAVLILTRTRQA